MVIHPDDGIGRNADLREPRVNRSPKRRHPGDRSLAYGTAPGHVAVGVRGPSIRGNPTHAVEVVANGPHGWITVTIGATGMVQFGNAELVDGSCQAENEVPVPDGY
jgi:hypothetical protein